MDERAVVLNELSLPPAMEDSPPSDEALDAFASLLLAIRTTSNAAYLVSPVQLWGSGVNAHTTFGPWAADPRNRDKVRQIASMQNRAPYETEFGVLEGAATEEYSWRELACVGLGYAHRLGLLAVSAPTRAEFNAPWLEVRRLWVSDESAVKIETETVHVRHAAASAHLESHREWLALGGSPALTGAEIWDRRGTLFAHLEFLSRVENDLLRLEGIALKAAYGRLVELEVALSQWNTALSAEPPWRSKVTPESASRIAAGLCSFRSDSGNMSTFSLHARYTPGAGRIHFEVNRASGRMLVAYVGSKRL